MPAAPLELDRAALPSEQAKPAEVPTPAGSSNRAERIANIVVLTLLFATPALMCVHAACANDFDMGWPGTCGKQGQGVPVGDGQPTLRVTALTVGGTAR